MSLAALGHNLAGGTGPEPWAVTAGGTAVMLLATALAGRERSAAAIATGLVATQLVLHELFAFDDPSGISLALHGHAGAGLGESAGMLVAHLTATLITAWWLARGEAALWSLLRRLGAAATRRLDALLRATAPATPRPGIRRTRSPRGLPAALLIRHSVTRRGPPLRAA
ncbi:MFS transporter [Streptosporangium sp. KLBMP 9127]|nr:MFS transporter [Streptosporangium sp. KLBMP 9127]